MPAQGIGSCANLTEDAKNQLSQKIIAHVTTTANDSAVAAYYLLDDYWGKMSDGLDVVYKAIRSVDQTKPTICAFSANLATSEAANDPLSHFKQAIQNYSPT